MLRMPQFVVCYNDGDAVRCDTSSQLIFFPYLWAYNTSKMDVTTRHLIVEADNLENVIRIFGKDATPSNDVENEVCLGGKYTLNLTADGGAQDVATKLSQLMGCMEDLQYECRNIYTITDSKGSLTGKVMCWVKEAWYMKVESEVET